ncbi:DNA-binding protein YbaB [Herbihabitans rhizosphaerae]|uniref:DNA-binding protein YbaB n=1 Tax=Herbihabitans rhizosphaerae TaxID=1872711 RepID=A0A4V2EUK0_9PSEU|nr:YbaB/EbfC family nucleoid-associated protein [Herbihabitans rhizosphaerae]RZS44843.1 DNA-binding protein YbaB [Herbihabitans rhizosphaerae]
MSFEDEAYALTAEIKANIERAEQARDSAVARRFEQKITGGIGTVIVDGAGLLLDVRLDQQAITYMSARAVGDAVLRAITEAERRSRDNYRDTLAAARREVTV